jgi:hypothetical protein
VTTIASHASLHRQEATKNLITPLVQRLKKGIHLLLTKPPIVLEPVMPDPDPSDFIDAEPVNRIALFAEFGLFEAVGFPSRESEADAIGHVVDLDQPSGMKEIIPAVRSATLSEFDSPSIERGLVYHCVYENVKHELDAGSTEEEIRAKLLASTKNIEGLTEVVRETFEAIEDALANRPMRYKNPFEF